MIEVTLEGRVIDRRVGVVSEILNVIERGEGLRMGRLVIRGILVKRDWNVVMGCAGLDNWMI